MEENKFIIVNGMKLFRDVYDIERLKESIEIYRKVLLNENIDKITKRVFEKNGCSKYGCSGCKHSVS